MPLCSWKDGEYLSVGRIDTGGDVAARLVEQNAAASRPTRRSRLFPIDTAGLVSILPSVGDDVVRRDEERAHGDGLVVDHGGREVAVGGMSSFAGL